jgi:hypothetical protein
VHVNTEPKLDKPQTPDLILFIVLGHISGIYTVSWFALLEGKRPVKMVEWQHERRTNDEQTIGTIV